MTFHQTAMADEFAGVVHMQRRFGSGLGDEIATQLSDLLGLPGSDNRWLTPTGRDVTDLCDQSDNGGFSSDQWTLQGWILDARSMRALMDEFPEHFRRRITAKSKPPAAYR